ncbi:unnamed protein product [Bursaphelenchus okinawaensis]|uniref:Alpha-2-macroglobulin RAP C-terminal domain-containing protein n=1 Tax=Bursaphelenchus okinawaensis TaxID=465554 RepID=A0A811LGG3_9BILA|nr:unnamed protein product [Bursaphelenchus okinawaensis]CAG9121975.1 unnamed protein product [Bursaphelenchus okinawaensis]
MDKINFIWQKAQSRLDRQEAAQKLQEELKKFDQLYVSIKHEQQQHHKNTKSVSEADDKLEKLLERYNLDEALNAFRIKYKHDSKKLHNTVNKPTRNTDNFRDVIFSNSRLQQLWSKINQNDEVSKAELSDLHRQFNDLKMKIKEYEKVQEDLEEVDENKVHDTVDHQQLVKEHKALNGEIEDSFQHLNAEIEAVLENPFENERVRKLWIKAKNTPKLIPNELNAIKSELRHLDRHFLQLQHHDDIMDEHKSLHAIEDDPNLASMTDQKDKILHKLTKLETYLNEKLHHTEL